MMRRLLLGLTTLVAFAATAATPEHERISGERAAANARYAEQERACRERFVVTPCVDAARREQQATLARLRRAELAIDDASRQAAATKRRQALSDKAAAQALRASEPAATSRRDTPRAAPAPSGSSIARGSDAAASAAPAAQRRAAEQRSEAKFEARARQAQARREVAERRQAERAVQGKVAAPLPVPSGASAP